MLTNWLSGGWETPDWDQCGFCDGNPPLADVPPRVRGQLTGHGLGREREAQRTPQASDSIRPPNAPAIPRLEQRPTLAAP